MAKKFEEMYPGGRGWRVKPGREWKTLRGYGSTPEGTIVRETRDSKVGPDNVLYGMYRTDNLGIGSRCYHVGILESIEEESEQKAEAFTFDIKNDGFAIEFGVAKGKLRVSGIQRLEFIPKEGA